MNKNKYFKTNVYVKHKGSFFKHQLCNYSLRNNRKHPFGERIRQFNEEGD